jgi:hypothetical protein
MIVSHSEIVSYLTCPRKHHHAYRDRRVARVVSDALETGSRIDRVLKGEIVELPPLERALMDGYRVRYKNDPITTTAEGVKFYYRASEDLTIVGEFDAVTSDAIVERKTTSESIEHTSLFWHRFLKLDPQVSTYLLARPEAKYVIVDALRKLAIRKRKDETDDDLYARGLETIAEDLDYYYQRVQIVRSKSEHVVHMRDVLGVARLIQIGNEDASYGRLPPRNPKACLGWGRPCEYLNVCDGTTTIRDDLRFKTKESHR